MRNSHSTGAARRQGRHGIFGWIGAATVGALLLISGSARAIIPATPIGIIPAAPIGIVQDEVGILIQDLQAGGGSKGELKKAAKMDKKLEQAATTDSFAKQLNSLAVVAKTGEKLKIAPATPIGEALDDVAVIAEAILEGARANGGLMIPPAQPIGIIPATPIGKRRKDPVKAARKGVAKGTKFLDKANGEALLSKKFKQWAKAAKAMDDFVAASAGRTKNWVVSSITVAPAGQGMDMDGDGDIDNAAAELVDIVAGLPGQDASSVTALLRAKLEESRAKAIVPIIQMWGFETFSNDPFVVAGLLNGVDCDDDTSDNYSGNEKFDTSATEASDGHPFVRAPTSFDAGGDYAFAIDGSFVGQFPIPDQVEFAGLTLPGDVPIGVRGTASENANDGLICIAIPLDPLIALLESELPIALPGPAEAAIRALADLDVDGDGTNESMSTALLFESVPCETDIFCEGGGPGTQITANWVISQLTVAGAGDGVDFTGDAVPDNGLADLLARIGSDFPIVAAQLDFDQFLADRLAASDKVGMIQMWEIDTWTNDVRVRVGVFNATDTDGNPADNFSGTEAFDPGAALDTDGHPRLRIPDDLGPAGEYGAEFAAAQLATLPIDLGDLPISDQAELVLDGTATQAANSGLLAFTIDVANLTTFIEDNLPINLPQAVQNLIAGFADVPGGLLSVALDFEAVPADLQ